MKIFSRPKLAEKKDMFNIIQSRITMLYTGNIYELYALQEDVVLTNVSTDMIVEM